MKKLNILGSFRSKKFKYGGYATLMTAIVLAVLIVINLVAGMIPLRIDLTREKIYSLSEQTYSMLKGLKDDIVIYNIGDPTSASPAVNEIIKRYEGSSKHISMDYIDPVRDPLTAQRYTKDDQQLGVGSIVVENGDVFRTISQYDMYNFSQETQEPQIESLAIEQRLTSAILYVSGAEAPSAYTLEGHGETLLDANIQKQMELENFEIKGLNLLGLDAVPEDMDLLIINSPQRDLSTEEEESLRDYLNNQGRAIFLMDVVVNELPNFQALLRSYGVEMQNALVIEGEEGRYIGGNPLYVLPEYAEHAITTPILTGELPLFIPGGQGIVTLETKRNTLDVKPLLRTSDKAFGRMATSEVVTMEKDEADLPGPFALAVAIEDSVYNLAANKTILTKLVVIGNSTFLSTGYEGSTNLFLNSLNWIFEREESITIRPKSIQTQPLNITEMKFRVYGGISVILIPLIVLILGLVVWLRRRNL